MPVFKTEIVNGPAPAADIVSVEVTKRGHGKISTGKHSARDGEEFYAEGEVFDIERSIANDLIGDSMSDNPRDYVRILKPTKA